MIRLITFLSSLFLLLSPPTTSATSQQLELKWLLANPPTGEKEKVSLFNPTDSVIDLSSWQIDDIEGGSSPLNLQGQIASHSSYLIEVPSAMFNNSGDSLRLLHNTKVVEETTYPSSPKGEYWVKDQLGQWCFQTQLPTSSFNCPQPTPTPTPTPTPLPTPFIYPPTKCYSLTITKVNPAPLSGDKEKIKIFNPHNFSFSLEDYQLDDQKDGGASPINLEGNISSNEEKEIILSQGMWNNNGDEVRLTCHSQLIDGFSYPKITRGEIIIRDKNNQLCFQDYNYWQVPQKYLDCNQSNNDNLVSLNSAKRFSSRSRSKRNSKKNFSFGSFSEMAIHQSWQDKRKMTPPLQTSTPLPPTLFLTFSSSFSFLFLLTRVKRSN